MVKKDRKGRVLRANEDQVSDGRYRYRFVDALGNRRSIYAWKLTTTDKTLRGKERIFVLEKKKNRLTETLLTECRF